jgi:hypothetical protein
MNLSTLKLIGYGVGALAVIALLAMVNGWRVERNHLRDWQASVVAETRSASGSPKLAAKDVPPQIKLLGDDILKLQAAIGRQNAAVAALAAESVRQQGEAAKASEKAQERAQEAESVSDRLIASSRSTAAPAAPCAPSKAVQEQWR